MKKKQTYICVIRRKIVKISAFDKSEAYMTARIFGYKGLAKNLRLA